MMETRFKLKSVWSQKSFCSSYCLIDVLVAGDVCLCESVYMEWGWRYKDYQFSTVICDKEYILIYLCCMHIVRAYIFLKRPRHYSILYCEKCNILYCKWQPRSPLLLGLLPNVVLKTRIFQILVAYILEGKCFERILNKTQEFIFAYTCILSEPVSQTQHCICVWVIF